MKKRPLSSSPWPGHTKIAKSKINFCTVMCTVLVQGKSGEKMAGVRPQLKVAVCLFFARHKEADIQPWTSKQEMHSIEQYGTTMGGQSTLQAHLQKLRLHSLEKKKESGIRTSESRLKIWLRAWATLTLTEHEQKHNERSVFSKRLIAQGVVHRKVMTKISAFQTWGDRRR